MDDLISSKKWLLNVWPLRAVLNQLIFACGCTFILAYEQYCLNIWNGNLAERSISQLTKFGWPYLTNFIKRLNMLEIHLQRWNPVNSICRLQHTRSNFNLQRKRQNPKWSPIWSLICGISWWPNYIGNWKSGWHWSLGLVQRPVRSWKFFLWKKIVHPWRQISA